MIYNRDEIRNILLVAGYTGSHLGYALNEIETVVKRIVKEAFDECKTRLPQEHIDDVYASLFV